jgi:hypothetical protein
VAGSAFRRDENPAYAGRTYVWWDRDKAAHSSTYWLEDIDIDGTRTLHGPAVTVPAQLKASGSRNSLMLAEVGRTSPDQIAANKSQAFAKSQSLFKNLPLSALPATAQVSDDQAKQAQFDIASGPSVKLLVRQTAKWCAASGRGISSDPEVEVYRWS